MATVKLGQTLSTAIVEIIRDRDQSWALSWKNTDNTDRDMTGWRVELTDPEGVVFQAVTASNLTTFSFTAAEAATITDGYGMLDLVEVATSKRYGIWRADIRVVP